VLRTEAGAISVGAAAGVSASLDAGTTLGRIHNALKNTDLNIHATTAYGDITARSLRGAEHLQQGLTMNRPNRALRPAGLTALNWR
jgi:hypothetical protein